MLSYILSHLGYLWIAGGLVVAMVLVQVFSAGSKLAEAFAPIIEGVSRFVVWFVHDVLYEGGKDMVDNLGSILFVLTCATLGAYAGYHSGLDKTTSGRQCDATIASLRQDYKFVPRTPAEKKVYLKAHGQRDWWEFW